MQSNKVFTKFILKQIAGTVAYNPVSHTFHLTLRNLSNTILGAIYSEGAKWDMSNEAVDDYIANVINEIELSYQPVEQSVQFIDVAKDIKPGIQITLGGRDLKRGLARLSVLYLGMSRKNKYPRFMVLDSTRLSLIAEDVLEPADNTLWSTGHPILFKVFRNGERYPNAESVYRSYKIEEIILIRPSVIHEVIDARAEFTFMENSLSQLNDTYNGTITFGKNPMTLFMHNYSSSMPLYANFDDLGVGKFSSNPDIVFPFTDLRNQLFGIVDDGYKEKNLNIVTTNEGEIYFDIEKNILKPKKAAKGKIRIKH